MPDLESTLLDPEAPLPPEGAHRASGGWGMRLVYGHRCQFSCWQVVEEEGPNSDAPHRVIEYKERETHTKKLVGKEATELSSD